MNTYTIRIMKLPDGEAPEWVRRSWVGCVFTAHLVKNMSAVGVVTETDANSSGPFFMVSWRNARKVLGGRNCHDTIVWWEVIAWKDRPPSDLLFRVEDCEVL